MSFLSLSLSFFTHRGSKMEMTHVYLGPPSWFYLGISSLSVQHQKSVIWMVPWALSHPAWPAPMILCPFTFHLHQILVSGLCDLSNKLGNVLSFLTPSEKVYVTKELMAPWQFKKKSTRKCQLPSLLWRWFLPHVHRSYWFQTFHTWSHWFWLFIFIRKSVFLRSPDLWP